MKERLDVLLVKRGLAASREKAKAVIMAGNVYVDNQKEDKAGTMFPDTVHIEVRGKYFKVCKPGRLKTGKGHDSFRTAPGGACMYGCGFFNRRFYRLYAPERSSEGLCYRCRAWTVGLETAE